MSASFHKSQQKVTEIGNFINSRQGRREGGGQGGHAPPPGIFPMLKKLGCFWLTH